MKTVSFRHFAVLVASALVPIMMGADGKGCGGDVTVGNDEPCVVTGCSGQICADEETASTCEWTDAYACYADVGICERDAEGVCGWRPTEELSACLEDPEPEPCVVTGCSGQLCEEEDTPSTCEWTDAYACYPAVGICERDAEGVCGWRQSEELLGCLENPRTPLEGTCVRNEGACESDADCTSGGCGGELCFNPALSEGVTTCECTAPAGGCGCINGQCAWYE
ncbi:MAG: hypothetical protein IPM79_02290 [Polyangiaceae bacterium]|nr:hypothetical protein [Polyangiaceae bacterium]